jgi:hypothetical protein
MRRLRIWHFGGVDFLQRKGADRAQNALRMAQSVGVGNF